MAKSLNEAKEEVAALFEKRCETNDPDKCHCEKCHPKGCYCGWCEARAYEEASRHKTPCPVCSESDWPCESCEKMQEAWDDEDDSYPGYYD